MVFAILAFTVVNFAGMFRGQDLAEVWVNSLIAMVCFACLGFCLGMLYDRLIKEILMQEDALMFANYLDENKEAGGKNSKVKNPQSEDSPDGDDDKGGEDGAEEAEEAA
jgi:hypothetical protein